MANKELVKYIKKTKKLGFDTDVIKNKLLEAGHPEHEVHKAATIANRPRNLKVFLMILFITAGAVFSLMMVFKVISNLQGFDSPESISAAVVAETNRCAAMENQGAKDACFYNFAKETKDANTCYRIENNEIKDFCLFLLADGKVDCSKILITDLREKCERS